LTQCSEIDSLNPCLVDSRAVAIGVPETSETLFGYKFKRRKSFPPQEVSIDIIQQLSTIPQ
jgi:hypothetical protein